MEGILIYASTIKLKPTYTPFNSHKRLKHVSGRFQSTGFLHTLHMRATPFRFLAAIQFAYNSRSSYTYSCITVPKLCIWKEFLAEKNIRSILYYSIQKFSRWLLKFFSLHDLTNGAPKQTEGLLCFLFMLAFCMAIGTMSKLQKQASVRSISSKCCWSHLTGCQSGRGPVYSEQSNRTWV